MRYALVLLFLLAACDGPSAVPTDLASDAVLSIDAGEERQVVYRAFGEGACYLHWSEPDGTGHDRNGATLEASYTFSQTPAFLNLRARCDPPSRMALTITLDGRVVYRDGWAESDDERGRYGIGGAMVIVSH